MYKPTDKTQTSFLDFNQPMGLHMNPCNRWIQMADKIPWELFETKYAGLFPSGTGNVAKPLRMALGALAIQNRYQYSDRELVEQIRENPYFQCFVGLPGYQDAAPFDASTLVSFRKRITAEMLARVNEWLLSGKDGDPPKPPFSGDGDGEGGAAAQQGGENKGTLAMDATCAPVNIRYPQDISLLNEAREKLEQMPCRICKTYSLQLPRRCRKRARKDYLAFAKGRQHTKKQIRAAVRRQLSYVRRDIRYLKGCLGQGCKVKAKEQPVIQTILRLYEQQEYMHRNKVHSAPDRIVSISQPWVRPIVRGKVKAPVEFGAKLDISIDSGGYGRLEKVSFDAYHESGCLIDAVERHRMREGHYPERVLADQTYRTRDNRGHCKKHGIRLSGPKLGRPSADTKTEKRQEYQDNTDRMEVERYFSRGKRCYGLGCIVAKLEETQLASIALSVFVSNLFKIQKRVFLLLFWLLFWLCQRHMAPDGRYELKMA